MKINDIKINKKFTRPFYKDVQGYITLDASLRTFSVSYIENSWVSSKRKRITEKWSPNYEDLIMEDWEEVKDD